MTTAKMIHTKDSYGPISDYIIQQILVGFEIGQTDDALLAYLNFWTQKIPALNAYFLHVFREDGLLRTFYELETEQVVGPYKVDAAMIEDMQKKIESYLVSTPKLNKEYHTAEGNALEALLEKAEELASDLLVIGQNTDSIHHTILAGNLIRKTNCDTLVIPDKAQPKLKKILVPIDFSDNSIKALRRAVSIVQQLPEPVSITCLHLFNMPNLSIYETKDTLEHIRIAIENDRHKAFHFFLQNFIPEERSRASIQTEIIEQGVGDIGHLIASFAKNNDVDLTIIGAKGHSRVHRLIMGSVTESVLLNNKNQPVLVVK